jgi:hypothetical protein
MYLFTKLVVGDFWLIKKGDKPEIDEHITKYLSGNKKTIVLDSVDSGAETDRFIKVSRMRRMNPEMKRASEFVGIYRRFMDENKDEYKDEIMTREEMYVVGRKQLRDMEEFMRGEIIYNYNDI